MRSTRAARAGSSSGWMATDRWSGAFARRTRTRGGAELTTILAGTPPEVLSMAGGFPNPETFATDVIDELAARLVREDAAVALQYTPCEGVPSVRSYLIDRQEQLQGRRPEADELMVTSGGMECIALMCQALLDPGDAVAVEAPTYLGALMAFGAAEAVVLPVAMDEHGLHVDALAERLEAGEAPKFVYVIPEYQNPTGRTMSLPRRRELVDLCRRHGVLVLEDVAYRELCFDGDPLPSLWSLAPDVVLQAGTFSKIFCPGVRLGWAVGPSSVVAELAAAKLNTDQCASGLAQRLVEEYGRAGHFERRLPGGPRAVRVARGGARRGAGALHAAGMHVDAPHGRLHDLAHAAAPLRHHGAARHRRRRGRRLRPRGAVLPRRPGRERAPALLQPADRGRARGRRRAPRGRHPRRAGPGRGLTGAP